MNKNFAAAAVISILLTGCAANPQAAAPVSPMASATPAATASSATPVAAPTIAFPDVAGMSAVDATAKLTAAGVDFDYFLDGAKLTLPLAELAAYKVESTEPEYGYPLKKGERMVVFVAATPAEAPKAVGPAASLPAQFPGYPLIVRGSTLDYRVANWFQGKLVDDKVVALIPGIYTPYNPNVKNLLAYYEGGGAYGDSVMKKQYMPEAGGATWPGVLPGPEEPK